MNQTISVNPYFNSFFDKINKENIELIIETINNFKYISIKPLDNKGEIPCIDIDYDIDENKLQILARLLGAVETDGHLEIRNKETTINEQTKTFSIYLICCLFPFLMSLEWVVRSFKCDV